MRERKRLMIMLIFMVASALGGARGAVRVALGGSAAFPLGDFGDRGVPYSGADEGFAGVGFAPHGQVVVELGTPLVGVTLDGSLLLNSVETDDIEDAYREEYGLPESFGVDADVDFWWMTIPFLVGPTVRIDASSLVGVYGTGLLGFALVSRPDVTVTGSSLTAELEYDMGVGFACAAETGSRLRG